MIDINPCRRCGEYVRVIVECVPYRWSNDLAVVFCQDCGNTECAPSRFGGCWADGAIERWNAYPEPSK